MKKEVLINIHPYLFAIYSILALYSTNAENHPFEVVLRFIALTPFFVGLAFIAARKVLRDSCKASILITAFVLLFFSYGHIYSLMKQWEIGGAILGRHSILLPSAIIIGLGVFILLLRSRSPQVQTNKTLAIISIVSIVIVVSGIITRSLHKKSMVAISAKSDLGLQISTEVPLPDIYYIILDGYGRVDILKELYEFDNSEFIRFLGDEGFFIADKSHSNYLHTELSLLTTLNMDYIETLASEYDFDYDLIPAKELIRDNRVRKILSTAGYDFIAFDTGFPSTTIEDAEIFIEFDSPQSISNLWDRMSQLSDFEIFLLETTAVRPLLDHEILDIQNTSPENTQDLFRLHRIRVQGIFDELSKVPELEGSHFVFAHVVSPHPPFIFDAAGNPIRPNRAFNLADGSDFMMYATREDYLRQYPEQLMYINALVSDVVSEIKRKSETPPIIIIQGDHGPGAYYTSDSLENTNLTERFSILNAYFVPDLVQDDLYVSITPINTYRLLLDKYFGLDFPLLPDQSFFTRHKGNPLNPTPIEW